MLVKAKLLSQSIDHSQLEQWGSIFSNELSYNKLLKLTTCLALLTDYCAGRLTVILAPFLNVISLSCQSQNKANKLSSCLICPSDMLSNHSHLSNHNYFFQCYQQCCIALQLSCMSCHHDPVLYSVYRCLDIWLARQIR